MKDLFIFPSSGLPIKLEQIDYDRYALILEPQYTEDLVTISDKNISINLEHGIYWPRFSKEQLIKELQKTIDYVKKFGV